MTRVLFLLVAVASLVAVETSFADTDDAAVSALAGAYGFRAIDTSSDDCRVTLKHEPSLLKDGHTLQPVDFTASCRAQFPVLRQITHWAATGGASIALFGEALTEIADFSPVQDGTGVYLRGGFSKSAGLYELRSLDE